MRQARLEIALDAPPSELARLVVVALRRAGVDVHAGSAAPLILAMGPPATRARERPTVALWTRHAGDRPLPALPGGLAALLAPSRYAAELLAAASGLPVDPVTLPVHATAVSRRDARRRVAAPPGFLFASRVRATWPGGPDESARAFERSNPLGLVVAFTEAFRPGAGATLAIDPGASADGQLAALKEAAARHPHVVLTDGAGDDLLGACDCYVSLHRDCAFGFDLAQAASLAIPVIATAQGGPLEYLRASDAALVACRPADDGADPELDDAVSWLRWVHSAPGDAAERAATCAAHLQTTHGLDVAGHALRRALKPHAAHPGSRPRAALRRVVGRVLQPLSTSIDETPGPGAGDRPTARPPSTFSHRVHPVAGVVYGYYGNEHLPPARTARRDDTPGPVLDVEDADAAGQLESLAPGSLGAIACRGVEDLDGLELDRLLRACRRAIGDGALVVESANPDHPDALAGPRPVSGEALLAHCRTAGFDEAFLTHPNGSGHVEIDRYERREYAVVAHAGARAGEDRVLPAHTQVPCRAGTLLAPAGCPIVTRGIQQTGEWEPRELAALQERLRPGMTLLDVGSHVGYFVLLGARAVGEAGRVIAVEADPDNAALLRENVRRSGLHAIEVVAAAAWSTPGRLELSRARDRNSGDGRLYRHAGAGRAVPVMAVRLDDVLGNAPVDVVLLDTQGTEHEVMLGFTETVARCRPRIIAEFWPSGIRESGRDPGETLALYRRLGYAVSVLGDDTTGDEALVNAAEAAPGGFCTLLLEARR
jgi:FkbM family methyltransferase